MIMIAWTRWVTKKKKKEMNKYGLYFRGTTDMTKGFIVNI